MICRGCGCDAPLTYRLCDSCRVKPSHMRLLNILGQAPPYFERGVRRLAPPRCTCGRDYATVPLEYATEPCPTHPEQDKRY